MFRIAPTAKSIEERLRVSQDVARRIRKILKGKNDPRSVDKTDRWVRRCYYNPSEREQVKHACDVLLDTCGIERIPGTRVDYANTGDTYAPTLVFIEDRAIIASWADIVESQERKYR